MFRLTCRQSGGRRRRKRCLGVGHREHGGHLQATTGALHEHIFHSLSCSTGRSSSPTEMTAERAAQKMQGARGSDAASDSICGGAVGLVAQPGRRARSPFTLSMSKCSVLGYLVGLCGAPRAVWCVRDNFGLTAPGRPGCGGGCYVGAATITDQKKIFSRGFFACTILNGCPPGHTTLIFMCHSLDYVWVENTPSSK